MNLKMWSISELPQEASLAPEQMSQAKRLNLLDVGFDCQMHARKRIHHMKGQAHYLLRTSRAARTGTILSGWAQ